MRNPRGGAAKDIDDKDVKAFLELAEKNNFGKILAHAPYTLNPCSKDEKTRENQCNENFRSKENKI